MPNDEAINLSAQSENPPALAKPEAEKLSRGKPKQEEKKLKEVQFSDPEAESKSEEPQAPEALSDSESLKEQSSEAFKESEKPVPSAKPARDSVQTSKAHEEPVQPAEPAIESPKASEYPESVKAIHDFKLPVSGGSVYPFVKDCIITDPLLIKMMLDHNCPVVPVEEDIDFHVCPKCHHKDPIEPALRDKIKRYLGSRLD